MENIINTFFQLLLLVGMVCFTHMNVIVGKYLLIFSMIVWLLLKIFTKTIEMYEILYMTLLGMLLGTNYLLYFGPFMCVLYAIFYALQFRKIHINFEILGFLLMTFVGGMSSFVNSTDISGAHTYSFVYLILLILLIAFSLYRDKIAINEEICIRLFVITSLYIGIGFFLTHTLTELFSTMHIFIYYIGNYGVYSNTLAGIISPFIVGCIIVLFESKNVLNKVLSAISLIMMLMIFMAIQSRGAYLGIFVGLLWLCTHKKVSKVILGLVIAILAITVVICFYPEIIIQVFGRFSLSYFSNGDYSNGRIELYRIAWKMFKEHPIIGCGFWQFGANGISVLDPHNFLLCYMASTGVIGTGGFLIYLFFVYKRLKDAYVDSGSTEPKHSKILTELSMMSFWIILGQGIVEPTLSTSFPLSIFILLTSLPTYVKTEMRREKNSSLSYEIMDLSGAIN